MDRERIIKYSLAGFVSVIILSFLVFLAIKVQFNNIPTHKLEEIPKTIITSEVKSGSIDKLALCEILPPRSVKRTSHQGIYITASTAQSKVRMEYIKRIMKSRGLDTIVVDINSIVERVLLPYAKEKRLKEFKVGALPWLVRFTEDLHKEGYIVTARIVMFKDDHLVIARPDISIRLPNGHEYRDHKWGRWVDPYSEDGRLYKELMAEVAAASGVDEVQFDYIRFPAEGKAKSAVFAHKIEGMTRVDIISKFLADVRERVSKYNVSMGLDIFGVTAWQSRVDIDLLGQDLKKFAKYLDVLSPMLYPSHFHRGYDGFANPGSEPYHFMNSGVKRSLSILSGEATKLVPWIQGFNLSSPNYGSSYITAQIKGCKDGGTDSFLIWNARNNYDVVPIK